MLAGVSGAAIRFDGQVSVYDARDPHSPCYACVFPPDAAVQEVKVGGATRPIRPTAGKLSISLPSDLVEVVRAVAAENGMTVSATIGASLRRVLADVEQERLDRALTAVKPQVVLVCYGMNDGIYHPSSPERLAAFTTGLKQVISQVRASGARLVLITPPCFDPRPLSDRTVPAGMPSASATSVSGMPS